MPARLTRLAFKTSAKTIGARVTSLAFRTPASAPKARVTSLAFRTPQTSVIGARVTNLAFRTNVVPSAKARVTRLALRVPGVDSSNMWMIEGGVKKPVTAIQYIATGGVKKTVAEIDVMVAGAKKRVWPSTFVQPPPPPPPPNPESLALQRFRAIYGNGGAAWGLYGSGNNISFVQSVETAAMGLGRPGPFDITKYYTSTGPTFVPQSYIDAAHAGRILHISFPWRATGGNGASINPLLPAPASSNGSLGQPYNECYLYSQMYDGSADAYLVSVANFLKSKLGDVPFFGIDFNHEPEATKSSATATPSASAQIRMGCFSDPDWYFSGGVTVNTYTDHKFDVCQEYVRASQYMFNFLRAQGVTNMLPVCTHASVTRPDWQHQALYDPTTDGFGFDPYGGTTPTARWTTVYSRLQGGLFTKWDPAVTKNGLGGTDLDVNSKLKPYFIQEWGWSASSAPTDAQYRDYINGAIAGLKACPNIKALTLYSSGPSNISGLPLSTQAFEQQSVDPYVNKR
jgi:hypothetical protein